MYSTARLLKWTPVLLVAFAAACQDQPSVPQGSGDSTEPRAFAARLIFAEPCRDFGNKAALIRDLIKSVNAERAKAKLTPLKLNDTLTQIAEFYACRLVDGDFFGHVDPFDGSTVDIRAANFGYAFLKIGENLAAGQQTVDQTVAEWMNSSRHRANILDPAYTEIGAAIKTGGKLGPYWVQEFGRPVTAGDETAALSGSPANDNPL